MTRCTFAIRTALKVDVDQRERDIHGELTTILKAWKEDLDDSTADSSEGGWMWKVCIVVFLCYASSLQRPRTESHLSHGVCYTAERRQRPEATWLWNLGHTLWRGMQRVGR